MDAMAGGMSPSSAGSHSQGLALEQGSSWAKGRAELGGSHCLLLLPAVGCAETAVSQPALHVSSQN